MKFTCRDRLNNAFIRSKSATVKAIKNWAQTYDLKEESSMFENSLVEERSWLLLNAKALFLIN